MFYAKAEPYEPGGEPMYIGRLLGTTLVPHEAMQDYGRNQHASSQLQLGCVLKLVVGVLLPGNIKCPNRFALFVCYCFPSLLNLRRYQDGYSLLTGYIRGEIIVLPHTIN